MKWSLLLFALVQVVVSTPLLSKRWDDFDVKHAWVEVPKGWELHGPAPADHRFTMRVGLKQDKFEDLVSTLYEVSDPFHPKYGKHLSKEEVESLVAPHPETVDIVDSWLLAHGVDPETAERHNGGSWVTVTVSVEQASRMLNATYNVYKHGQTDDYVVRTTSYSLPRVLHEHVDVVTPTTYFGTMRSMKATSRIQPQIKPIDNDIEVASKLVNPGSLATVPSSCSTTITPACLRALYNTTTYVPKATATNKLGVAGYLDEFANNADLQTFFRRFRTDAVGGTFQTVQVNGGGNDQSDPGVEANLDIQYTEGISFPTPNIYYSTGGSPPFNPDSNTPTNTNEPYLDWLNFILGQSTIPQTFTTSYGDDEQTVPFDYATSVCNLFAQLGARGSSIMFSSGDDGVGAGDCSTNDGKNTKHFQPNFPASCPFVTTVSPTISRVPHNNPLPFRVSSLSLVQPTLANSTLLDVPIPTSVGGTSASSPTFAGVISLLNDFRISQAGFNDITSGSNPGCGTNGFTAGTGWDPVTGLGTPDFGKLQALIG
ncbi:tripeptidyl-peptidase II [Abortiporus biennis]